MLEAAQTALVVAECREWKRPPSMRSSAMRCPPASATATVIAIPACLALATAVLAVFLGPAGGGGLEVATNIEPGVCPGACVPSRAVSVRPRPLIGVRCVLLQRDRPR